LISAETATTPRRSRSRIRQVALRYFALVAATLRPGTLVLRTDSLIVFCGYLAAAHPEERRLPQLTRAAPGSRRFPSTQNLRPRQRRICRRSERPRPCGINGPARPEEQP